MKKTKTQASTTEHVESVNIWRRRRVLQTVVMYFTMVAVSTAAIHLLEHASLSNAFRTAIIAAIGKTLAANWVSGIFE